MSTQGDVPSRFERRRARGYPKQDAHAVAPKQVAHHSRIAPPARDPDTGCVSHWNSAPGSSSEVHPQRSAPKRVAPPIRRDGVSHEQEQELEQNSAPGAPKRVAPPVRIVPPETDASRRIRSANGLSCGSWIHPSAGVGVSHQRSARETFHDSGPTPTEILEETTSQLEDALKVTTSDGDDGDGLPASVSVPSLLARPPAPYVNADAADEFGQIGMPMEELEALAHWTGWRNADNDADDGADDADDDMRSPSNDSSVRSDSTEPSFCESVHHDTVTNVVRVRTFRNPRKRRRAAVPAGEDTTETDHGGSSDSTDTMWNR